MRGGRAKASASRAAAGQALRPSSSAAPACSSTSPKPFTSVRLAPAVGQRVASTSAVIRRRREQQRARVRRRHAPGFGACLRPREQREDEQDRAEPRGERERAVERGERTDREHARLQLDAAQLGGRRARGPDRVDTVRAGALDQPSAQTQAGAGLVAARRLEVRRIERHAQHQVHVGQPEHRQLERLQPARRLESIARAQLEQRVLAGAQLDGRQPRADTRRPGCTRERSQTARLRLVLELAALVREHAHGAAAQPGDHERGCE